MSDEDKDIDVESEDDEDQNGQPRTFSSLADKRAHHNALERKRRDHIKDSFAGLRDSVPSLAGEKSSRAQILHKATEHIQYMRRKNHAHQTDIEELKRDNLVLEQQIRQLEKSRASGQLVVDPSAAALLAQDLLPIPPANADIVGPSQLAVKSETVIIERPNNAGDHDDYTITPKRLKTET